MNEFEVLRKAFPQAEGPTPEATDSAHRQLQELIHGDGSAGSSRSFRSFVRAGWIGTALTATTALVAMVGIGGALLVGRDSAGGSAPSGPTTTAAPRLTEAAQVLIAVAVLQEENEKASGRYFRVRSLQLEPTVRVGNPRYTLERRSITESWMPMKPGLGSWFGWVDLGYRPAGPADAAKWRAQGSPMSWRLPYERTPISMSGGVPMVNKMSFREVPPGYYLTGDQPLSAEQIAALPTDPVALETVLGLGAGPEATPVERDNTIFDAAGRLLFGMPSPPKLRGAALRVLAALPGTHVHPGIKDPLGRVGTEVTLVSEQSKASGGKTLLFHTGTTYIIDPATGRLLSSSFVSGLRSSLKTGSTVVLESGWTDDKPTPPSTTIR